MLVRFAAGWSQIASGVERSITRLRRSCIISTDIMQATSSLLQELRQGTRELHQKVEADLDIVAKLTNLEQYSDLLKRFWVFYAAIDETLSRFDAPEVPKQFLGPRAPRIVEDLQHLGAGTPIQGRPAEISIDNLAEFVGFLYVMEGAALGGQIILRHLTTHLNLTSKAGARFFGSDGEEVGPRWREFQEFLERVQPSVNAEVVVAAAVRAFETFRATVAIPQQIPV